MNIIYLSSSCSDEKFNELRNSGITQKLPQAQKYHSLLIQGLAENISKNIYAISAFPTNRTWTKKVYFKREEESQKNITYIYGKFLNFPILRQLTRLYDALHEIKKICKKCEKPVIICDILNQSLAKAARIYGKKHNILVIGIVTDVPGYTSGARRKSYSFFRRALLKYTEQTNKKSMCKYDAYLFLTEAMNEVVNTKKQPYIVLEGHCDYLMQNKENKLENKSSPKVAMYAGGIHKEFGIELLVNAFVRGNFKDWELHIYGDGNYQHDLKNYAKKIDNLKYFGVRPNQEIVENQLKATLLLNPRLTAAEYVKYSFPSKTLECMASGTPLCTTKLPGMPKEYFSHVYFFENETEDGMLQTLKELLKKEPTEHHKFGLDAQQFVLSEKNNKVQAAKLIDFINKININEANK